MNKIKIFEGATPKDAMDLVQRWLDKSMTIKVVSVSGYAHVGGHVFIVVYELPSFGWSVK